MNIMLFYITIIVPLTSQIGQSTKSFFSVIFEHKQQFFDTSWVTAGVGCFTAEFIDECIGDTPFISVEEQPENSVSGFTGRPFDFAVSIFFKLFLFRSEYLAFFFGIWVTDGSNATLVFYIKKTKNKVM